MPKIYSQLQLKTPLLNVCVSIVHYDQIYFGVINEPFKFFVGELYLKAFLPPKIPDYFFDR